MALSRNLRKIKVAFLSLFLQSKQPTVFMACLLLTVSNGLLISFKNCPFTQPKYVGVVCPNFVNVNINGFHDTTLSHCLYLQIEFDPILGRKSPISNFHEQHSFVKIRWRYKVCHLDLY